MTTKSDVAQVRAFWNTEACGTHLVGPCAGEQEFFAKFREFRYRVEWHLPLLVPFGDFRGRQVLEIGTGNGADGAMFALNGAHYTGADLTEAALEATRRHFAALGLSGTFRRENAEALGFADASFDLVYSHGVLHHTPDTARAVDEVFRVLRPGGRAIVMLYHRHSFNYWVRIMAYMRLRVLGKILSRAGRWGADRRRAAAAAGLAGVRGNEDRRVLELHYENFLRAGWGYLQAGNFVNHCADGPECPVARAFSRAEVRGLFRRFANVRLRVAHLPLRRYLPWVPLAVEKALAWRVGWYLFIDADKPAANP